MHCSKGLFLRSVTPCYLVQDSQERPKRSLIHCCCLNLKHAPCSWDPCVELSQHCFSSSPMSVSLCFVTLGGLGQKDFAKALSVVADLYFVSVQDSRPRCVFCFFLGVYGFYFSSSPGWYCAFVWNYWQRDVFLPPQWKAANFCY